MNEVSYNKNNVPPGISDIDVSDTVGNEPVDGDTVGQDPDVHTTYILSDTLLPSGVLETFRFFYGGVNESLRLQVWRPLGGDTYLLLHQQPHVSQKRGVQEVTLN